MLLTTLTKIFALCCRLLPWDANVATYRFMGGDKCMLPFIKNTEQKTSNGLINHE